MLAYKFRSSNQLSLIIDIVRCQRLHCSDWAIMNDPLEGCFYYSEDYSERLAPLTTAKQKYRVCALSKTFRNRLLWAHYASGFDGVAIEVDLPKHEFGHTFHDVVFQSRNPEADLHDDEPPQEKALFILKHKHTDWAYEEEVRIIQKAKHYQLKKPVTRIILGRRFNEERLPELRRVCEQSAVVLKHARLEDEGVFID